MQVTQGHPGVMRYVRFLQLDLNRVLVYNSKHLSCVLNSFLFKTHPPKKENIKGKT